MKKFKQLSQDEMKNVVGGYWNPGPCGAPAIMQTCSAQSLPSPDPGSPGYTNFCACANPGTAYCTPGCGVD